MTIGFKPTDKFFGSALTHMREVAFGNNTRFAIKDTVDRAERMRDDDALISQAEEKRKRKAAKRLASQNKK